MFLSFSIAIHKCILTVLDFKYSQWCTIGISVRTFVLCLQCLLCRANTFDRGPIVLTFAVASLSFVCVNERGYLWRRGERRPHRHSQLPHNSVATHTLQLPYTTGAIDFSCHTSVATQDAAHNNCRIMYKTIRSINQLMPSYIRFKSCNKHSLIRGNIKYKFIATVTHSIMRRKQDQILELCQLSCPPVMASVNCQ